MRVIAGTYRSRVLKEVENESTRSTKDRVKESIFNSIINYLPESDILDLFAGSGSLGIEAISRGARHCVFVENNKDASKVIKENIRSLKIEPKSALIYDDYMNYLLNCGRTFDVILLDPPYSMEILNDIVSVIQKDKLLNKEGIVVCLYSKNNIMKEDINGIIEYKQKTIGVTKVSYMKWGI